ncbi:NUDIX hydrolase [Mangrovibacillus cuniculi]|uniref:NUDIX domain-containing protein n=1 Tax=Mangrovibacillus cuniculi TaxID=2593652 RepID=A0A7S8HH56_9BACI|nr:NUDIX domain-containing protein [Mangrovibacillus cuniculi]QPC48125.1 NUDIX domain-containing protein [Mangrovibacillus cuniculi]
MIMVVDEDRNSLYPATREKIHREGLWHEVFHCWLLDTSAESPFVYLQERSLTKADFPGLYDISAVGHILKGESIQDGVREVEEELGLSVKLEDLRRLAIVKTETIIGEFKDFEHPHVYLLDKQMSWDDFSVQLSEVRGMARVPLRNLFNFTLKKVQSLEIEGFRMDNGVQTFYKEEVDYSNFVPHDRKYWREVLEPMVEYCNRQGKRV